MLADEAGTEKSSFGEALDLTYRQLTAQYETKVKEAKSAFKIEKQRLKAARQAIEIAPIQAGLERLEAELHLNRAVTIQDEERHQRDYQLTIARSERAIEMAKENPDLPLAKKRFFAGTFAPDENDAVRKQLRDICRPCRAAKSPN